MKLDLIINLIAEEAYRHGLGYDRTYRSVGRYQYKNPVACCSFPIEKYPFEIHVLLEKVYKHAFRQGFKKIA